jgi:hypothetical protein
MDHGGYASLDDDEEVRDEDLALDDEVEAAFDGGDGTRGGGDDLDVDVEVDDDDEEEIDPVTTVDDRSVLQYAEAAGPGLRMRSTLLGSSSNASGSQPAKRKGTRKRARSTADTGVHRKPNVTPRSNKH